MSSSNTRPKWWQLYLSFPLLIVLFIVENRLKISTREHQVVQFGIILFVYGLILFWLKANSAALSNMDRRQYHRTITVILPPSFELTDADTMFELPASEIKGVLSDTFEMDYIDAESFPVDEVAQDLKKE